MAFRMRLEVDDWFKHVFKTGPLTTKFDLYYLCLMMGLAGSRLETLQGGTEFIDNFVGDYKPVQRLIVGLLLITEMSRLGLDLDDREEVRKLIDEYLDPSTLSHLRDEGFSRLNDYANGGFNLIVSTLGNKPHHLESFLQWYAKALANQADANPFWEKLATEPWAQELNLT